MKSVGQMSQHELAAFIQTHLANHGIDVILSGGAAVSYYVGGQYVSEDIDLVARWVLRKAVLKKAMEEIGFTEKARYFEHPEANDIIEILPGPPTVGSQPIGEVREVRLESGILRILNPTDCAKDRLAGYFYWGDTESFLQAVMVGKANQLDFEDLEKWAKDEGKEQELQEFLDQIKRNS